MSLTVRMRSSSGGSLSTGEVWDRHRHGESLGGPYFFLAGPRSVINSFLKMNEICKKIVQIQVFVLGNFFKAKINI